MGSSETTSEGSSLRVIYVWAEGCTHEPVRASKEGVDGDDRAVREEAERRLVSNRSCLRQLPPFLLPGSWWVGLHDSIEVTVTISTVTFPPMTFECRHDLCLPFPLVSATHSLNVVLKVHEPGPTRSLERSASSHKRHSGLAGSSSEDRADHC